MSVKSFLIAGASAFILAACQPEADTAPIETPEPPVEEAQAVWDKGAMVAAADPRAVEAGLEVLRNGPGDKIPKQPVCDQIQNRQRDHDFCAA